MKRSVAARILLLAARMVKRGWLQFDAAKTADGRSVPSKYHRANYDIPVVAVCFTEAVFRAAYQITGEVYSDALSAYDEYPVIRAVCDALLAVKPDLHDVGPINWNNDPERTQEDVVALLRAAAQRALP